MLRGAGRGRHQQLVHDGGIDGCRSRWGCWRAWRGWRGSGEPCPGGGLLHALQLLRSIFGHSSCCRACLWCLRLCCWQSLACRAVGRRLQRCLCAPVAFSERSAGSQAWMATSSCNTAHSMHMQQLRKPESARSPLPHMVAALGRASCGVCTWARSAGRWELAARPCCLEVKRRAFRVGSGLEARSSSDPRSEYPESCSWSESPASCHWLSSSLLGMLSSAASSDLLASGVSLLPLRLSGSKPSSVPGLKATACVRCCLSASRVRHRPACSSLPVTGCQMVGLKAHAGSRCYFQVAWSGLLLFGGLAAPKCVNIYARLTHLLCMGPVMCRSAAKLAALGGCCTWRSLQRLLEEAA